jgi:hypothetical protein
VTVADLQQFLSDLSKLLRVSRAAGVAGELDYVSAKLAPFKEYGLKAFADFLEKADAYSKGALAPKPKTTPGKKAKATPADIDQACARVLALYDRAIDPTVTVDEITAGVQALEGMDPPKATLDDLLKRMGASQKFKTKADALKAVRQKILGRKGAFDRVNA